MDKKFANLLCDPKTGEELQFVAVEVVGSEVITGRLTSSKNVYPIKNGIPRFVEDEGYSNNFGWQWNKWARVQFEDENVGLPMENYTRNMFGRITELSREKLNGKLILDMGCGSGRFTDIATEFGATVIAIDYSSAIDAAKDNFAGSMKDICFIQGDALQLPLKENSVDFSFSIGVLHHTPSPKTGVDEAYRVTKPDGEFSISVYGSSGYYTFTTVQFWRRFFKFLWLFFKHWPPLIYSHIVTRALRPIARVSKVLCLPFRVIFPFVNLPDLRWSILDTFDSITPSYQSGHECFEVYTWFKEAGFSGIRPASWGYTNFIGRK